MCLQHSTLLQKHVLPPMPGVLLAMMPHHHTLRSLILHLFLLRSIPTGGLLLHGLRKTWLCRTTNVTSQVAFACSSMLLYAKSCRKAGVKADPVGGVASCVQATTP